MTEIRGKRCGRILKKGSGKDERPFRRYEANTRHVGESRWETQGLHEGVSEARLMENLSALRTDPGVFPSTKLRAPRLPNRLYPLGELYELVERALDKNS